jgi:hypothetical protein
MISYVIKDEICKCQHCEQNIPIEKMEEHYTKHREAVRKNFSEEHERQHPNVEVIGWDTKTARVMLSDGSTEVFMEFPLFGKKNRSEENVSRWVPLTSNITIYALDSFLLKAMDEKDAGEFDLRVNSKGNFSVYYREGSFQGRNTTPQGSVSP